MSVLWQFGNYAYPRSLILSLPWELVTKTRFADVLGRPGQYTQGGLSGARRITLQGQLTLNEGDDKEALWDTFVAAHLPGMPQALYLGRDDRFLLAEVVGIKDTNSMGKGDDFPTSIPWEVQFVASDPMFYAQSPSGPVNINTGGTLTTSGTSVTAPILAIVLSALGIAGTLTLTNVTTGKTFTLTMPGTLTTLTVDCAQQKITDSLGRDVTALFLAGSFWELVPGANVIAKTATGGASSSAVNVSWWDRWA
jgi:hypothetical protein